MLFHALEFWLFLPVVLVLFRVLPLGAVRGMLLLASYVFYGWWDPRFLLLILASTAIDFVAAGRMPEADDRSRKRLLIVSLCANLGFLGFFKYFDFFAGSIARAMGLAPDAFAISVVLPVGISFYTFQSMSYTIDVYRGQLAPVRSFRDFALFVSFFPQLVAGPIVRARDFFPQLEALRRPEALVLQRGVVLIAIGLVKKMVFADQFALISDTYFNDVGGHPGAAAAWSGTIAFGLQIFFDFSGYTDMARGVAKLLGFHFPVNFERPYLSASITEFWRRWHISLSTWLRDYLYIPLGGNRGSELATYRNLMLTMLLGGLWHGASWNFVLWGGYHGLLLALHRALRAPLERCRRVPVLGTLLGVLATPLTVALVFLGWIPFRAQGFEGAWSTFSGLFAPGGESLLESGHHFLIGFAILGAVLEERYRWSTRVVHASLGMRAAFLAGALVVLELFAVTDAAIPFVYFQF